jgi:pimeloyl-ACP methyl ester carboxylesterase
MSTTRQLFVLPGPHPLAGVLDTPEMQPDHASVSAERRRCVLIAYPLFEARKACHRPLAELAARLAARGSIVLRVDYRGTGDSPGTFETTTPAEWIHDLRAAWDWLRAEFPSLPADLVAVRDAAALAALAVDDGLCPDRLVYWEPVSGRDSLRQLLQRKQVNDMVTFGEGRQSRKQLIAQLESGDSIDLDGYPLTAAQYRGLTEAVFTPTQPPAQWLILTTAHDDAALRRKLPETHAPDIHCHRLPPFWNTVGYVDTTPFQTATLDFLIAPTAVTPPDTIQGPAPVPPSLLRMATPTGTAPLPGTPIAIALGKQQLRAVYNPPGPPHNTPSSLVVFIHGWSGCRLGPHRMFVKTAAAFAQAGIASLRLDLRGRGDSDGVAAEASIAAMVDDVLAAIACLRSTSHPALPGTLPPLYLLGICSGCKVAIGAASQTPDLAGLLLWSAEPMGALRHASANRRKTASALKTYARKLLRPETWRKILRGQVQVDMVQKAVVQHETRDDDEAATENQWLAAFRAAPCPVRFIFGTRDPDTPKASAAYAGFCRDADIPFEQHHVTDANHSFYGLQWESEVINTTREWIEPPAADEIP